METNVGPLCRGPVWMPITPKRGSFLHAESHLTFVTADPFQASVAQRRFNILVVDDQPHMLSIIVRALEEDQYTVSKAAPAWRRSR